jgi:hypothetical protein
MLGALDFPYHHPRLPLTLLWTASCFLRQKWTFKATSPQQALFRFSEVCHEWQKLRRKRRRAFKATSNEGEKVRLHSVPVGTSNAATRSFFLLIASVVLLISVLNPARSEIRSTGFPAYPLPLKTDFFPPYDWCEGTSFLAHEACRR